MAQRDHAQQFLDALLRFVPEDKHALLWTRTNKISHWLSLQGGVGPVVDKAVELADADDVYVAVSVANAAGGPRNRIESANSRGLMGLWADIDIADEAVHKKSFSLPPTQEAAMDVLTRCGLPPSLIVHSGHGLQAWWLFAEFWSFDTEQDRLEAAGLAQRWNSTLRVHAAENKWIVDSTFDLARVMRVPGTFNRKIADDVKPVLLVEFDETLVYNPSDFEGFMVDDRYLASRGLSPARSYEPGTLVLSETAYPDPEKLEALRDNMPVFEATWQMKRSKKDMPDGSPSSYDASLAVQAARAGWSDQEIAALILAFRRKHKLEVAKALRPDYVKRTISFARNSVSLDDSSEAMEDVADALDDAKRSGDPEAVRDARRAALDVIGTQLGIEVLHIIRFTSEPPTFELVTPTQRIFLGGSDGILNQLRFRASVWETTGHSIPRFNGPQWDRLTALIPRAWEDQDLGADSTSRGQMEGWLQAYLAARPPVASLDDALDTEYPFVDDAGQIGIFGPSFTRWLWLTYQERVDPKALGRRLRSLGATPDKVNTTDARTQRPTSRSVWKLAGNGGGGGEPAQAAPAVPPAAPITALRSA